MARLAVGDYPAAQALLEEAIATRRDGQDPMPLLLIRLNTWADPVLEEPAWRALRARLGYTPRAETDVVVVRRLVAAHPTVRRPSPTGGEPA